MSENFSLTWAINTILSEFNAVQQTIWPCLGNATTKKTKTEAYSDLAIHLLENIPQYINYVYILKEIKHYKQMIKRKITKLQEQYNAVKEHLEVIGASFLAEEPNWAKSELQNVWNTVKHTCLYFYIY